MSTWASLSLIITLLCCSQIVNGIRHISGQTITQPVVAVTKHHRHNSSSPPPPVTTTIVPPTPKENFFFPPPRVEENYLPPPQPPISTVFSPFSPAIQAPPASGNNLVVEAVGVLGAVGVLIGILVGLQQLYQNCIRKT